MDTNVPYMGSVTNLNSILDKIQGAGVPETFNLDFLRDLGFASSNDRPMTKMLKYLGLLDSSGKPLAPYREFVDHTKAKKVLAARLRVAYDDLFLADKQAHTKASSALKGWFKTKTGAGDASAEKMASTFKAFASYADFSNPVETPAVLSATPEKVQVESETKGKPEESGSSRSDIKREVDQIGFVYRIEIHLPDTQNIETFRSIFKALREELI